MAELNPERALRAVGELLAYEGEEASIVVIGGSALILLGIVERATTDVDVVAIRRNDGAATGIGPPDPLPEPLQKAIERVAEDFGLPAHWLNTMAGLQWRTGLPPGLEGRLEWHEFGGLRVGLASRYDLIFFKLYAAADDVGPGSVHYQDLIALEPTQEELRAAASWIGSQDASPAFRGIVDEVVRRVRMDLGIDA